MTKYNITLKEGASKEELEKAKEAATSSGGKITDVYTLIKGFVVEFPDDAVNTLSTNDHITVEQDGEVHTLVSA